MSESNEPLKNDPYQRTRSDKNRSIAPRLIMMMMVAWCVVLLGFVFHPLFTDPTLLEMATRTHAGVSESLSGIPSELILGLESESLSNYGGSCDPTFGFGPLAHSSWNYGFSLDLVKPVSNVRLLKAMAPTDGGWKLESTRPTGMDDRGTSYLYKNGDGRLELFLDGEAAEKPRVGIAGYSRCVLNREDSPWKKFTAPEPTGLPKPVPGG